MEKNELIALELGEITYIGKLENQSFLIGSSLEKGSEGLVVMCMKEVIRVPTIELTHDLADSLSNLRSSIKDNAEGIFRSRAANYYLNNRKFSELEIGCTSYIIHPLDDVYVMCNISEING